MDRAALVHGLVSLFFSTCVLAGAGVPVPGNDPLAAIDLNRNAIIADIVRGFEGDRAALSKRLSGLRADHLLSASLASTRESLDSIMGEAEKSRDVALRRASAKSLGSATTDLVYTPLTPCRLIDTRGFGAPIQGGAFAPNARRNYVPQGLCGLPTANVASILISFTTQNLTPNSGGYLAILAPNAPVAASVDVFNLGSEWSASNTAVITGPAAQFDIFVAVASAQVVIDVLGYFAPPQGGAVTSLTAGTGLTGGTITSTGTVALAAAFQLPQACTNGQVATSNGAGGWTCATPIVTGGTVTGVTASAPLASSGGTAPNISLSGALPVANGGTGQSTLAANGVVFGQGASAVGTAVGQSGQVLTGTSGAPAWTGSPSLSGNLVLVASTQTTGNVLKGGTPFIHTYGFRNTFIGLDAGNLGMTGDSNTASGANAFNGNTFGSGNTASGHDALSSNTIGNDNTAIGRTTLLNNTSGSLNTAFGAGALFSNSTGSNNIALGANAGINLTTGSANINIGSQGVAGEASTIRIGSPQTRAFIAGIRGVTTGVANAVGVLIDSNGQLGTTSSSRRFKDDIADMDAASDALMKLRPVTFHYKADKPSAESPLQYGLIAEEVAEVYPGLVAHSADGQVETVMYHYLPPMLLNELQKQQRVIEALQQAVSEIGELRKQVARLAAQARTQGD